MADKVRRYIASHTKAKSHQGRFRYGTKRNSADAAFAWRRSMAAEDIATVEGFCYWPMIKLGYGKTAKDAESLLLPFVLEDV